MLRPLTIVAVAVVAAIGLGVGLNFAAEPEERTTYKTLADLTPIVEHDPVDDYAELSPASNWTGFSPYSSFTYVVTDNNSWNRYPIQPSADPVTTQISNIQAESSTTLTATTTRLHIIETGSGIVSDGIFKRVTSTSSIVTVGQSVHLKRVSDIAATAADTKITIVADAACMVPLYHAGSYVNSGVTIDLWACGLFGSGLQSLAARATYTPATASSAAQWVGADASGSPVWTMDANSAYDLYIVWGGQMVTGYPAAAGLDGYSNAATGSGPSPVHVSVTTTQIIDGVSYMDIRYGVTIPQLTAATENRYTIWDNGYKNGRLTMLIKTDSGYFTVKYSDMNTNEGTIFWFDSGNGDCHIVIPMTDDIYVTQEYPAVAVEIDALANQLIITPILDFIDFTNWQMGPNSYVVDYANYRNSDHAPIALKPIESLMLYGNIYDTRPFVIGIVETDVATDPNDLLWDDARINVAKWFPTYARQPFSIYFRSIVTAGDLWIEGLTFPVEDGQITYDGKKYPLQGLRVDYMGGVEGGDVIIRLPDGSKYYDLNIGGVTTQWIHLLGIWYAQIDLASIQTETVDVMKYDPDGWKGATAKAVIMIFLAVCVALALWAMRNREIGAGGIGTIMIALAMGWIILGLFA